MESSDQQYWSIAMLAKAAGVKWTSAKLTLDRLYIRAKVERFLDLYYLEERVVEGKKGVP